MQFVTKAPAEIRPVENDDSEHGQFEVILSAPTKDRDGETLKPDDWKTPLPEHITFDADHGMSVASTVGSGKPWIDDGGNLRVSGTYSSIPRAQEVRTLVNEGHIRTTSVAYMTEKTTKDGKSTTTRELLNGAFVAIPANRDALVLDSKDIKRGARNNSDDAKGIQSIHDTATSLGADCSGGKSLALPATKADADDDPTELIQSIDAALDEATDLINGVDLSTLPEPVAQAIGLLITAEQAVDNLLDVLGIYDPDDDDDAGDSAAATAAAAVDNASTAAAATAAADDAEELNSRVRSLAIYAEAYSH